MEELAVSDAMRVGGGFSIRAWLVGQVANTVIGYTRDLVTSGQVDYAGVAQSQGTYYNTVGA